MSKPFQLPSFLRLSLGLPSMAWVAAGLVVLTLSQATECRAAGKVFQDGDTTVIEVVIANAPDPYDNSPGSQAARAINAAYIQSFPALFQERYAARYKADPKTYGNFNWEKVELRLKPFSGLKIEGVTSDLMAIAGGTAPDILYVNFNKSDTYIRNGFLYPLDDYLDAMPRKEVEARVSSKIWPVIRRKGPEGELKTWAMPYGGALGRVLVYNKPLFDEKKIPYPTQDWTWEDMLQAARKLTDPAKGTYGLFFGQGKTQSQDWVTFLWSAGGEVMDYDEAKDQWKVVFGSDAGATALDYYLRLNTERWTDENGRLRRGYALRDQVLGQRMMSQGKIGMSLGYMDGKLLSQINPDTHGLAPVPLGPDGRRASELNSRMMGLFSDIREPAVRDASWEFIRFVTSEQARGMETKILVENGYGRFINPKYLREFGYSDIERFSPPGWAETFDITIENGRPEPYGRNSAFAYELMSQPMEEAVQLSLSDKLPQDPQERLSRLHDILSKAESRANEVMIGQIPPQTRRARDITAFICLTLVCVAFFTVFRMVAKSLTPPGKGGGWTFNFQRYWPAYVLLVPALLTILLWKYIPLGNGSIMAFQDYKLLGKSTWIGLGNFGDVLWDKSWWSAVWNSARFSALTLFLTFLPPIILAILLQEIPKGKVLYRVIFYLPAVLSGLVTLLLWKQFYEPSDNGMLNSLLLRFPAIAFVGAGLLVLLGFSLFARRLLVHEMPITALALLIAGAAVAWTVASLAGPILFLPNENWTTSLSHFHSRLFLTLPEPMRWLSDPNWAMLAIILPAVWAGMGPGCLIYLAALKGIPDDYYEAADIDGATVIDKILFIVFPTLKTLIIINFVGAFIHSWQGSADSVLAMTGGGANTEVADLHLFYKAFVFLEFGPATAMSWILGLMLIGFTVYQLRILARVEFRTTGGK